MEKRQSSAAGREQSPDKLKKFCKIRNFFSEKYDIFNVDRGWYNGKYYGVL